MPETNLNIFNDKPLIIAGPCSAESPEQLASIAASLKDMGVKVMRAGLWKPRTRPNSFEGKGVEAMQWMKAIKKEFGLLIATEVASTAHVEAALEADIDILWIGARTTVNPFSVQEIANSLKGTGKIVLLKNPINPDLALWMGAIERVRNAGIEQVGAIHRGFSSFQKSKFRNQPAWKIPIELKSKMPEVPLICDPSHIGGNRDMIFEISQKALDLSYEGLMIETHPDPDNALSDAEQQITPAQLQDILKRLRIAEKSSDDVIFINQLEELREKIDDLDRELLEILATRLRVIAQIGEYKKDNNVAVLQLERWKEISQTRPEWAKSMQINSDYVYELYKIIHEESIRIQTEIMNKENVNKDNATG
jgi:chorismate mutase